MERVHRPGPGRGGDVRQRRRRTTATQDERAAHRCQIGGERRKAVMQPPPLRRADAPFAGRIIVEDVDRKHRSHRRRGAHGGVVGKAKAFLNQTICGGIVTPVRWRSNAERPKP